MIVNAPAITMGGQTFYRGWRINPQRDGSLHVRWLARHINYFLPRFFEFHGNVEDCFKYCDALLARRPFDAKPYEDHGIACRHTFDPPASEGPTITVNPKRLLAVLLGLDPLDIPAAGVLKFTSFKGRHWADEIHAGLVAGGVFPDVDLESIKTNLAAQAGCLPDYQRTGINLPPRPKLADEEAEEVSREIPIATFKREFYDETITLIASNPPYYARKIVRDGSLIYLATSWHKDGPWSILQANKERCSILGIAA